MIDLGSVAAEVAGAGAGLALPSCPVVGMGPRDHPLAPYLDTVIEPPVRAEALVAAIVANPHAAAVVTELLRLVALLPLDEGLVAESMAYGLLQGSAEHAAWLAARVPGDGSLAPGRVLLALEGGTLAITLDRPAAGNAIDRVLRDQLDEAFTLLSLDSAIRRAVLRGRGKAFCLGAELAEFGTTRDPAAAHAIRRLTLPARLIARCADRLEVEIGGACVGAGLEMAAFARHITATRRAWFQLPELAMGILPGAGGCVSLTRRIGRQRACLMILSGRRISAQVALGWGLVDALVDDFAADDGGADVG